MNSGLRAEHRDVLRPAALVTPRCEAERLEPIDQIRDRHLLTIGSGRVRGLSRTGAPGRSVRYRRKRRGRWPGRRRGRWRQCLRAEMSDDVSFRHRTTHAGTVPYRAGGPVPRREATRLRGNYRGANLARHEPCPLPGTRECAFCVRKEAIAARLLRHH